jgi:hypothetical protein
MKAQNVSMSKCYIFLLFLFIAFELCGSEYSVRFKPASVDVADIDFDGDPDIVLGHHYFDNWTGFTILYNNGEAEFTTIDTFYYGGSHENLILERLNGNDEYDYVTQYYDDVSEGGIGVVFDYDDGIYYDDTYLLTENVGMMETACISSTNVKDIIFASNYGQFMGILYNNGNGVYSDPEYYDLENPPGGLACGDLNGDDREDIVVCGSDLIVFFNYPSNFVPVEVDSASSFLCDVKLADIDNNGNMEMVCVYWGIPGVRKRLEIYSNDGYDNFILNYSKWIDEAMGRICVSDLNNDEFPDVVYNVSYGYPHSDYELFHTYILFNNQDGTFQDPVNYYTGICSHKSYVTDLDGNGWNDIITLNYDFYNPPPDTGSVHILFNDGTGNFVEEPQTDNTELKIENVKCKISNYPNPFNPVTTVKYNTDKEGFVEINIYDIKGRLSRNLFSQTVKEGKYELIWNGKNDDNQYCSSGIYLMKFEFNGKIHDTGKLILLK